MTINRQTLVRGAGILLAVLFVAALSVTLEAQEPYRKPPQAIMDVLNAPETPQVSISPQQDLMILADSPGYASIGDHAQPMLRLAGLRIDPATNGPSRPRYYTGYTLTTIPDGVETAIGLRSPTRSLTGLSCGWAIEVARFGKSTEWRLTPRTEPRFSGCPTAAHY